MALEEKKKVKKNNDNKHIKRKELQLKCVKRGPGE